MQLESLLTQSLDISVVPPINPEDSAYKKFAKWQTATQASQKIYLHFKSKKHRTIIKTVECLNFGGVWRETLTDSAFLDYDDILTVQATGNAINGDDYIALTGNYAIEISSIPKDNLYSIPENFGKDIGNSPTLIRFSNIHRARLHLQNVGEETVHIAFGSAEQCIPGECLALIPQAVWNDERVDKAIISSSVWGMVETPETTSRITGVEVNWV